MKSKQKTKRNFSLKKKLSVGTNKQSDAPPHITNHYHITVQTVAPDPKHRKFPSNLNREMTVAVAMFIKDTFMGETISDYALARILENHITYEGNHDMRDIDSEISKIRNCDRNIDKIYENLRTILANPSIKLKDIND